MVFRAIQHVTTVVLLFLAAACAALPDTDALIEKHTEQAARFENARGPLSAKKSAELIAELKRKSGDIDILDKQIALEQAIVGSPLILGTRLPCCIPKPQSSTASGLVLVPTISTGAALSTTMRQRRCPRAGLRPANGRHVCQGPRSIGNHRPRALGTQIPATPYQGMGRASVAAFAVTHHHSESRRWRDGTSLRKCIHPDRVFAVIIDQGDRPVKVLDIIDHHAGHAAFVLML